MSRTLTANTTSDVAASVTLPGYFIEILFLVPLRISTRGTLSWGGNTWTSYNAAVSGLGVDGSTAAQSGQVSIGNTDLTIGALILNEGIADRTINIWKFYGDDPPDDNDPIQVFAGVGDAAAIDPDKGTVTITLQQQGGNTSFCPRTYINADSGFSVLPAAGTVISWGGEQFVLTPTDN